MWSAPGAVLCGGEPFFGGGSNPPPPFRWCWAFEALKKVWSNRIGARKVFDRPKARKKELAQCFKGRLGVQGAWGVV